MGDGGDFFGHQFGKTDGSGKPCAYCSATLRKLHQIGKSLLYAPDTIVNLLGITGEFLTQGDGRCILRMGASDFYDVLPGLCLVIQGVAELLQGGQQAVVDFLDASNMHGRRECVVGRLRHVHMVIGVNRFLRSHFAAQHFNGTVGDDFIGIHVGLGAGAGLPDDEREMLVKLSLDDFL